MTRPYFLSILQNKPNKITNYTQNPSKNLSISSIQKKAHQNMMGFFIYKRYLLC